jgi:DNA-binding transcriptional LysR family regulator
MISYDYYRTFYYAAKYRNFTHAAEAMNTSQSNVSHCIQTLEQQLGCRLFIRKSRGIELTADAEALLSYVSRGCEQFMLGEAAVAASVGLDRGIINLAATQTALHYFLFDALDQFHQLYANVKFKIATYNTYEALAALSDGRVDLAVVTGPVHVNRPIVEQPLQQVHDVLLCGQRYEALAQTPFDLHELCQYPLICLTGDTATRRHLDSVLSDFQIHLQPAFEITTADLILPMVRHNIGLSILPREIALEDLKKRSVIEVPTRQSLPVRRISMLFDREHPQSIASKRFQSFLLELHGM